MQQQDQVNQPQNQNTNEFGDEEEEYSDTNERQLSNRNQMSKFNPQELEEIQSEIQEMTKKIEHEKINQRICNERYEKKFVQYCELSGKPIPLSKEEKEKDRTKHSKKAKNHKVYDRIERKRTKESLIEENQYKTLKQMNINTNSLEILTNEINEIELENSIYKGELAELRKVKNSHLKEKQKLLDDNEKMRKDIKDLEAKNSNDEKKVKTNELKQSIITMENQRKSFNQSRDDMESQYHKIIEESIKREREAKKDQAKKRQMLSLVSDSKAIFKGANTKELEKQKKMLESDEISDRTPIIEAKLAKWKYINKYKKYMIEKYQKNCELVRKTLDKLVTYTGVDDYKELIIVFEKAEKQLSDIDFYNTELKLDIDKMEFEKQNLKNKIQILSEKYEKGTVSKEEFMNLKKDKIERLKQDINDMHQDILNKRNFFTRIQPVTDEYLEKLDATYLADYIADKCQIDKTIHYNEKIVNSYLSNVLEYYKLIQMFDAEINKKTPKDNVDEMNFLRNDIRNKLNQFESQRLMTENLSKTMKNDFKGGLTYDEIMLKTSQYILSQFNEPENTFKSTTKKRTLRIKTEPEVAAV